jgi:hypothetical protein
MKVYDIITSMHKQMPECLIANIEEILILIDRNPKRLSESMYCGKIISMAVKMKHDIINIIKAEKIIELTGTENVEFSNKISDEKFKQLTSNSFTIRGSIKERDFNGHKFFDYSLE